jgi:hypothetical protein
VVTEAGRLVPVGAELLQERGTFEFDVQQCTVDLLRLLGAGAGKHPAVSGYRMPVDAGWGSVVDFYTAHLQPSWPRIQVPEVHHRYRLAMWRTRRLIRSRRFAIALFDEPSVGSTVLNRFASS